MIKESIDEKRDKTIENLAGNQEMLAENPRESWSLRAIEAPTTPIR